MEGKKNYFDIRPWFIFNSYLYLPQHHPTYQNEAHAVFFLKILPILYKIAFSPKEVDYLLSEFLIKNRSIPYFKNDIFSMSNECQSIIIKRCVFLDCLSLSNEENLIKMTMILIWSLFDALDVTFVTCMNLVRLSWNCKLSIYNGIHVIFWKD